MLKRITPLQLLNTLACLIIAGLSYLVLHQDYQKSIHAAENNTRFVASLMAQHTQSKIDEIDQLLNTILIQLTFEAQNAPALSRQRIDFLLEETRNYNDQIMDLLILDAQGQIKAWTVGEEVLPDIADRQYVSHHLENPGSDLYVGEPLLSRVHPERWFFAISKALRKADGSLKNIAVAIIDIDEFQGLIKAIERLDLSSLALISKTGTIISRIPGHAQFVGKKIELPYESLYKNDSGNFYAVSPFDNMERIAGFRHLNQHNITAFATLSQDNILKDWYTLRDFILFLLIVIFSFIFWFNIKIYKAQKRNESQRLLLSKQARIDELTGLYNRRHILQELQRAYQLAKLDRTGLSLLMIDIDHFKAINDLYGHDIGDTALRHIANILQSLSRKETLIGRLGGEEFLVALPATTAEDARHFAERMRQSIANSPIAVKDGEINCTISIGLAACDFRNPNDSEKTAIKQADEAMYHAKSTGRNKVIAYADL